MIEAFALWLAQAQPQRPTCGPREAIIEQLADKYQEQLQSLGLGPEGKEVVEVYANLETGTWTLLSSKADGSVSCVIATGSDWEQNVQPLDPPGRKT